MEISRASPPFHPDTRVSHRVYARVYTHVSEEPNHRPITFISGSGHVKAGLTIYRPSLRPIGVQLLRIFPAVFFQWECYLLEDWLPWCALEKRKKKYVFFFLFLFLFGEKRSRKIGKRLNYKRLNKKRNGGTKNVFDTVRRVGLVIARIARIFFFLVTNPVEKFVLFRSR